MTASSTTERWAVYGRISDDPNGLELGVTDQLHDGRALAAAHGAEVVAEYKDDDISAFTGKHRPGYTALLRDAEAGLFTVIVVTRTSRLWRNRGERATGFDVLAKAGVQIRAVKGPDLDLSTAAGMFMGDIIGAMDTMDSAQKRELIQRAVLRNAMAGRPNGMIPYGWRREYREDGAYDVLHPDEAPVVAEMCRRVLAGESFYAVTQWLRASGVPAPGARRKVKGPRGKDNNADGTRWPDNTVRALVLRPANAGLRKYHAGQDDEQTFEARVEPIVTREEYDRLHAIAAPRRSTHRPGARRYLLTGSIGECGVCGKHLKAWAVKQRTKTASRTGNGPIPAAYKCSPTSGGHVSRNVAKVDALVLGAVAARLAKKDAVDLLLAAEGDTADLAMGRSNALHARLNGAAIQYAEGVISGEQLALITATLRPQIAEADRAAEAAAPSVPVELLRKVAGANALDKIEALTVVQQRLLVGYLIGGVVINRSSKPGAPFNPADIALRWRGAAPAEAVALHVA